MQTNNIRTQLLIVLLLSALLVPWLGETLFYSKGEPREAVVAVSMLQSGDWVLPLSYGSDFPYKPPLLAWMIAALAWLLNGGVVNEFLARLPSALAAVAMITAGYAWVRRATADNTLAALTAAVTVTQFEVFRAATACRVDMVLTACMVCALYQLYVLRTEPRSMWRWAITVLLLSGGVLTKGPVGALLPCLAAGLFYLLRGENFFVTLGRLAAVCVVSMVIPALWYYAAWQRGGEEFLSLAMEENVGRLTGTMSYGSHLHPWWYNFLTLASGMLPWTLALILTAVTLRRSRGPKGRKRTRLTDATVFAIVVPATVVLFYCFPASKRSVYLLPAYPFLAYWTAVLVNRASRTAGMRIYTWLLAVAALLVPVVVGVLAVAPPRGLAVAPMPLWRCVPALLPALAALWWMFGRRQRPVTGAVAMTYMLYLAYVSVVQPMVLNPRSDARAVEAITAAAPAGEPVYTLTRADHYRMYSLNYYLGDRLRVTQSVDSVPPGAAVLIPGDEAVPAGAVEVLDRTADFRRPVFLYIRP